MVGYKLASQAGFEPATRCLEGSRSVHLSYWDSPSSYNRLVADISLSILQEILWEVSRNVWWKDLFPAL